MNTGYEGSHNMAHQEQTLPHSERGQALVEYALIVVLIVFALFAVIAITGPAVGNVFSNTVCNLLEMESCQNGGMTRNLSEFGGPTAFWREMTQIAQNPPTPRGFPAQPTLKPTETYTPGGPTITPIPTRPTSTRPPRPTVPPTRTPTDIGHEVPFYDPMDEQVWWRVDDSVWLGGEGWKGEYFAYTAAEQGNINNVLSRTPNAVVWNQDLGAQYTFNLDFNWGNQAPFANPVNGTTFAADYFAVRFTRNIYVFSAPLTVQFTLDSDDGSRLKVGNTTVIDYFTDHGMGSPRVVNYTFATVGPQVLTVEYYEKTGNAAVKLGIVGFKGQVPDDQNLVAGQSANCPWTRVQGTQPNSVEWAWKENTPSEANGFPKSMVCSLELRGYVDIKDWTNVVMSFWEVWDIRSNDTKVELQVTGYEPYQFDASGNRVAGPNWAGGRTYLLRQGSSTNYAWTRSQIPLNASDFGTSQVTYRFRITSSSADAIRRWYLDDILINNEPEKVFTVCSNDPVTCGSFWTLDDDPQKADFITSYRWRLTPDNAKSVPGITSLSFDVTDPNTRGYVRFGSEQTSGNFRIHTVELRGPVDLRGIAADGQGGLPDYEGDSSFPLFTFDHTYDLGAGDRVEVQWTRDPVGTSTVQNWQRVGTLPLAENTTASVISAAYSTVNLQLKQIPNWNTQPFRLRLALYVSSNSSGQTGWWIDNIVIERESLPRFATYPYCDDAEGTMSQWLTTGLWGIQSDGAGAFGTGQSFSDSPNPLGRVLNYEHNTNTSMIMRYRMDLLNDTPENLTLWGGNKDCFNNVSGRATRPVMTFWFQRRLAAQDHFVIDLYRYAHAPSGTTAINGRPIWSYRFNANNPRNFAWERVQIDLLPLIDRELRAIGSETWASVSSNANRYDDDFYFAFRLESNVDVSVGDGLKIDNIQIAEYEETVYKFWDVSVNIPTATGAPEAGLGMGTSYSDNIDVPGDWFNRFVRADWSAVNFDARSGVWSMHNTNTTDPYAEPQFSALEIQRIIDLRGTKTTDLPTLYFWNRYWVGPGDRVQVDVAVQDIGEMTQASPPRNTQNYGYEYLWGTSQSYSASNSPPASYGGSSWQNVWWAGGTFRNETWVREQVDLSAFADNPTTPANEGKRIRIRFVLNAMQNFTTPGTGWYLDDILIEYRRPRIFPLPFIDEARSTANWVTEGRWGLAPDKWRGSGGGPASLGTNSWNVWWYDCTNWLRNTPSATTGDLSATTCTANQWDAFFNNSTSGMNRRTIADTNAYLSARPSMTQPTHIVRDTTSDIFYEFGRNDCPPLVTNCSDPNSTWRDYYAGRFIRNVTVTGGDYLFIMTTDDGARLRFDTLPTSTLPTTPYPGAYWNLINQWRQGSRQVYVANRSLTTGNYQLTMEWFEWDGEAYISLQVGANKFSFSDSPKPSVAAAAVPSIAFGNSSLMLNGIISLTPPVGVTNFFPNLQYYTYYDFGSNFQGAVEVSNNGGFGWIQDNLRNNCPTTGSPSISSYNGCDPNIWGAATWLDPARTWQLRQHDLRSYNGQNITLRFRLRTNANTASDGWWITDITINN